MNRACLRPISTKGPPRPREAIAVCYHTRLALIPSWQQPEELAIVIHDHVGPSGKRQLELTPRSFYNPVCAVEGFAICQPATGPHTVIPW